jgi:heme A synthase
LPAAKLYRHQFGEIEVYRFYQFCGCEILNNFFGLASDAVLLLHAAVVVFVLSGLLAVVLGGCLGWAWVRGRAFRLAHLGAIGVVVLQAWLGQECPLTTLENWLRLQAGAAGYGSGFVAHWVARLLYWEAPAWVFTLAYTAFGALVVLAWRTWPPQRRRSARQGSIEPDNAR